MAFAPPRGAPRSLDFGAEWARLTLSLEATLVATPLPGGLVAGAGTLTEDFALVVDASRVGGRLTALLALNQSYLEAASAEEVLASPRCAIGARS